MPGPGTWSAGDILTAADLNAIGAWTAYTPVLAQNGTRTATVDYAEYCQINKMCIANVRLTCTTSGSAGSNITVTLPVSASATATRPIVGSGYFYDDSLTDIRLVSVWRANSTTVAFSVEEGTSDSTGLGWVPSLALANNDIINFSIVYQVA
jgi:hypothetical protein